MGSMTSADGWNAFCFGTKTSQGLSVCLEDKMVNLHFSLCKAAAFILSEAAKHLLKCHIFKMNAVTFSLNGPRFATIQPPEFLSKRSKF